MDNEDFTAQDSDSLYKSLTSLAPESSINKPDPFIIKRSKEINKWVTLDIKVSCSKNSWRILIEFLLKTLNNFAVIYIFSKLWDTTLYKVHLFWEGPGQYLLEVLLSIFFNYLPWENSSSFKESHLSSYSSLLIKMRLRSHCCWYRGLDLAYKLKNKLVPQLLYPYILGKKAVKEWPAKKCELLLLTSYLSDYLTRKLSI